MREFNPKRMVAAVCLCLCLPFVTLAEDLQVQIAANDLSIQQDLPKNERNIIVLVSEPQGENKYGPTETMMLATINTKTGASRMTLLQPRLLVEIPAAGKKPLAEAYALGGENLVMKTLNASLGLNVQDYVNIDLRRFSAVVEAVGGIQMQLTDEEAAALSLTAGEVLTLNTEQTLAFMRLPKTDPLQDRQYDVVMQALFQGTRDKDKKKLTNLLKTVLGSIDTNMSLMDMVSVGLRVMQSEVRDERRMPAVEDLVQVTQEQPIEYETDMEALKTRLHTYLFTEQ